MPMSHSRGVIQCVVFWVWLHPPLLNPKTTMTSHPESRPKAAAEEDEGMCSKRGHESEDGGMRRRGEGQEAAKQGTGES